MQNFVMLAARSRAVRAISLALVTIAIGCGGGTPAGDGGDAAPPDAVVTDTNVTDSGPGDGGGSTLAVIVLENVGAATRPPLAGAMVAFDRPDGSREEVLTDNMGRATFRNFDWAAGVGAVTIYKTGYYVFSRVGLTSTDAMVTATLARSPARRVNLTGMMTGMSMTGETVLMSASIPSDVYRGTGGMYTFAVSENAPYILTGVEFVTGTDMVSMRGYTSRLLRWFRLDRPAQTGDGMLDIDLSMAMPVTPVQFRTSIVLPPASSQLGAMSRANVGVTTIDSGYAWGLGYSYRGDVSADGTTYDTMSERIEPMGLTGRVVTRYTLGRGEMLSSVYRLGVPMDGGRIDNLYDVPNVTAPAAGTPYMVGQPVTVASTPMDAELFVNIVEADRVVWTITGAVGARTIQTPRLPSNADAAALGRFTLRAYAGFCQPGVADNDPCQRLAVGTRWIAMRP